MRQRNTQSLMWYVGPHTEHEEISSGDLLAVTKKNEKNISNASPADNNRC